MPTELDIAEAMARGDLPSPQKVGTMWLWSVRITGTGAAYRAGLKEFCWREPAEYLNERFLKRCNGLPLIWIHPEKVNKLNSVEFSNRVIGTIMLPFVKNDEVWGVARVYDADAAAEMQKEQLSTSPGVVFTQGDGNQTFDLPDGETFLIEGVPSLLDHLAVLSAGTNGVWDKSGPPSGVLTSALGDNMTEEEKAAAARADAAKLDAVLKAIKDTNDRMDAMAMQDKARKDSEEAEKKAEKERADKARRDAARKDRFCARKDGESEKEYKDRMDREEEEERKDSEEEGCEPSVAMDRAKKARKDAETAEEKRALEEADKENARADAAALQAENGDLKSRLAAIEAFMIDVKRDTPAAERDALAAAQARADSVANMLGERMRAPMPGETSLAYRKFCLDKFKAHSPQFKDSRFDSADDGMVKAIEEIVYNDAQVAARKPAKSGPGILTTVVERKYGRDYTYSYGDPMAWMQHFSSQGAVGAFNRNPKGA